MSDRPIRRVVIVLTIYLAVSIVVVPAADWARRIFALPGLFSDLVLVGLVLGVPAAAALAWKYPTLGQGDLPRGGSPPEG